MILSQLRSYLAARRRVALIELTHRFDADPEALRGMLEFLERRGRVRKLPSGTDCPSGCNKCEIATLEIFEWREPGTGSRGFR